MLKIKESKDSMQNLITFRIFTTNESFFPPPQPFFFLILLLFSFCLTLSLFFLLQVYWSPTLPPLKHFHFFLSRRSAYPLQYDHPFFSGEFLRPWIEKSYSFSGLIFKDKKKLLKERMNGSRATNSILNFKWKKKRVTESRVFGAGGGGIWS